jgi:hypothetical protein
VSDFLRVLGDDRHYKGRKTYLYLHRGQVCRVYPVYAEVMDGTMFRCTDGHPKAQVVSYELIDSSGNVYHCGDKDELAKLGLDLGKPKRGRVGFMNGVNKDQLDLTEETPDVESGGPGPV